MDLLVGRGWEEGGGKRTQFKKHYAFQILFSHDLLQDIQGTAPGTCRIVNVDGEYDLYQDLIVKYSDWPTYSYGIKQIAKLTGF